MRILLVEDDRALARQHRARRCAAENFVVDVARNGEDGQHLGETEAFDAAVLDLGLPEDRRRRGAAGLARRRTAACRC